MRRILVLLATLVLASGTGLVLASPAQAALPKCTSWTTYWVPFSNTEVVHVPSAGNQTGTLDCVLRQGDHNDAVKILQRGLRYCRDRQYIDVDGDYGFLTYTAVYSIQIDANQFANPKIAEDGEYGPQTRRWAISFPIYSWPANQMTQWCQDAPY